MPYKPNQVGETELSRAYPYMWASVIASPINLACNIYGVEFWMFGFIWGLTMGGMMIAALGSNDEFIRSRLEVAMRFVVGAIALYLFAAFIANIYDLGHSAGYAMAAEEPIEPNGPIALFWTDALTLASALAVIFYAGYAYAVWKEGR